MSLTSPGTEFGEWEAARPSVALETSGGQGFRGSADPALATSPRQPTVVRESRERAAGRRSPMITRAPEGVLLEDRNLPLRTPAGKASTPPAALP